MHVLTQDGLGMKIVEEGQGKEAGTEQEESEGKGMKGDDEAACEDSDEEVEEEEGGWEQDYHQRDDRRDNYMQEGEEGQIHVKSS
jgi:hypothetical protein